MARWLLDCRPFCGRPWRLGVATTADEAEQAFRLRYQVFAVEGGYPLHHAAAGRDVDSFDEWCDHLILWDEDAGRVIGTYRAIRGGEAVRRGGFYGKHEFDFTALYPIADQILQGSRTCVAAEFRHGPAIQYLSYGMELLLRETASKYFLGVDSFQADSADEISVIHSYVAKFGTDPGWRVTPQPGCEVAGLREVPVTDADERRLPPVIRTDLRLGFLGLGRPAWDPEFGSYDIVMLARRDRMTRLYQSFQDRIERGLPG
jgi:putative hemolysin